MNVVNFPSQTTETKKSINSSPEEIVSDTTDTTNTILSTSSITQLENQKIYQGYIGDERKFLQFDKSNGNSSFYTKKLKKIIEKTGKKMFFEFIIQDYENTILELTQSLGRIPTIEEVLREDERQEIIIDAEKDHIDIDTERMKWYKEHELEPQRKVIQERAKDFPTLKNPLEAFANGPARIDTIVREDGKQVQRLIITTPDSKGNDFNHPVMTDEEINWVNDSAEMIAEHAGGGKVFIAGLGLGLLNKRLHKLGVKTQVVAELNHDVIDIVGTSLQTENKGLEIRQGDFKQKLQDAYDNGEQFDAISIDAFPNSADEVNRDASSKEVLELAWKVLKPGGILTFYPDSMYIPQRVLKILFDLGIPRSSIHYTISEFDTSEFTEAYHYGSLMSVPVIQKPLLSKKEASNLYKQSFIESAA